MRLIFVSSKLKLLDHLIKMLEGHDRKQDRMCSQEHNPELRILTKLVALIIAFLFYFFLFRLTVIPGPPLVPLTVQLLDPFP